MIQQFFNHLMLYIYHKYQERHIMLGLLSILLLLLPSLATQELNISQCTNYYNSTNATQIGCNGTSCVFSIGLRNLITNQSKSTTFVLCLDLPGYDLTINEAQSNDTYVEAIQSAFIYGFSVTMNQDYSLLCQRNLVIASQTFASFQQVSLTGQKIYVQAQQNIFINGSTFINQSVVQTQCSCFGLGKSCSWNFSYPRFYNEYGQFVNITDANITNYTSPPINTATFIAQDSININQTLIKYSIVGIFSENVNISSTMITTNGLGYPSDSGPGCGYFDEVLNQLLGCMGSGGSHGGFGGNSSPQNCYLLVSKPPYDDIQYPNEPGSGGGFFLPHSRQSSSGGGVINIQCQNLSFQTSYLYAQGKNGIQGGGGGAGGSISLDYSSLNATGAQTIVSANGGSGDKMSSSGSGGRIRLWNHNWKNQNNTENPNLVITVAGGTACRTTSQYNFTFQLSCGQNGSVFTSPCRPGSSLSQSYICVPCKNGTYQLTYGYSSCIQCPQKPSNSYWVPMNSTNVTSLYVYNSCTYNCNQTNANKYLGKCLSNSEYFIQKYNIIDIMISLGMIGVAVIIYLFVIFIKKLTQQEAILSFDDPNLTQAYRKKFFRLQDLPYHQMRLYFTGQNNPYNPWKITDQAENSFYCEMRSPVTKINHIISKVIKQINKKSEYKRLQKIILTIFTYTYYPLGRIILSSMRKQKARQIFQEVNKYNAKIPQHQLLGMKLHVKPQDTVASLEIFNYTKSVLDFYIENYFPLYILLEKAPFGGHVIDFSDPFLKVFINQIVQKEVAGKSVQNFLKQANKFLKNQAKLLSCLNYLWTLSDINPKYQAFLWQPNQILGIERKYKINKKQQLFLIISSQNLSNSHFLLKQKLPSPYMPEIQSLKHKFNIRKDLATEEDGNSIWIINNEIGEKTLLWIFGSLTTIFLLMIIFTFFINMLIITGKFSLFECNNTSWGSFGYGFGLYFCLWPFCDFAATFLNFKVMLSKDEYVLENAIAFNIITIIKSLILFICVAVAVADNKNCLRLDEYFWLSMIVVSIIIFIIQIMLRARIIALSK